MGDVMIDVIARMDHRRRQLPADARCSTCAISWPAVLFRRGELVRCHGCQAVSRGRSGWELHHLGGKGSSFTVLIPVNVHSILTLVQELTWRSEWAPASPEAIGRDIESFLIVGGAYVEEVASD